MKDVAMAWSQVTYLNFLNCQQNNWQKQSALRHQYDMNIFIHRKVNDYTDTYYSFISQQLFISKLYNHDTCKLQQQNHLVQQSQGRLHEL
jgi:hypothetical protein